MKIKAIIFDLYDTLLYIEEKSVLKQILQFGSKQIHSGSSFKDVMKTIRSIRHKFMTTDLSKRSIPKEFRGVFSSGSDAENRFRQALFVESKSTTILPGVLEMLRYLREKGYLIGVVSNVSTFHKEPYYRYNIDKYVDVTIFSCDFGYAKPDKEIYMAACKRLGVKPAEAVFIGDSYRIDVKTPVSIGMQAIHVSPSNLHHNNIKSVSELGLLVFDKKKVIDIRDHFSDENNKKLFKCIDFKLPDSIRCKYNLLYSCKCLVNDVYKKFFLKRYSNESLATIEKLAYDIAFITNLQKIEPIIVKVKNESFLLIPFIDGVPYNKGITLSNDILFQLGRHVAFAFIFANTDFHPRNTIISYQENKYTFNSIDLEYCFLNCDYKMENDSLRYDAKKLDLLLRSKSEKIKERPIITNKTVTRFINNFINLKELTTNQIQSFYDGINQYYESTKHKDNEIMALLYGAINRNNSLIIGFSKTKRAFTEYDIECIKNRIHASPEQIYKMIDE